jgi:hypothetical protein
LAKRVALLGAALLLCSPAAARANGDPASDYLLVQNVFLPFNAKISAAVRTRLSDTIVASNNAGYRIKVAVIGTRYDLGTAFSLYNNAQRYSEFLGLELSFQYRGHLLVVMPNGFGSSIGGKRDPQGVRALAAVPPPGPVSTNEVEAATTAVRRLAAAAGHRLPAAGSGAGSATRDRLMIAAGVVALAALLGGIVFFRRDRASS